MAGWVNLTKKAVREGIDKDFLDALIDDLTWLKARIADSELPNGSFESDSDGDGQSDSWTVTDYAGGSHALDTTDPYHGQQCLKMTATSGGGYVEALSDSYRLCAPGQRIEIAFHLKASAGGVRVRCLLLWYDASQGYLSTSTVYDSTANPTSWARRSGQAVAPASARYYRVQVIVGESGGTVDAEVRIDGMNARVYHGVVMFPRTANLTAAGTYSIASHIGDERARRALIQYEFAGEGFIGGETTFTLRAGVSGSIALQLTTLDPVTGQAWVGLDDSEQYTVSTTGATPDTCKTWLVGYEV